MDVTKRAARLEWHFCWWNSFTE